MTMDYYEYLGIPTTATLEEIKAAYLNKRAQLQSGEVDEQHLETQLQSLDKAYEILLEAAQSAEAASSAQEITDRTALAIKGVASDLALAQAPQPKPQRPCPHCGALNPVQATMCLTCGQQMARPCPACGQLVSLVENVCPRCDTVIPEYDRRRFAEAEIIQKQVTDERRASRTRVDALEAIHRINARMGVVFWVIVVVLCVGLTLITAFLYNYFSQIYH
jgi:hypothetical protein